MRRAVDGKSIVLGGLCAGLLVGVWDGIHAGVVVGVGSVGIFTSALLAGAVDLWLGLLLGLVTVMVATLNRWGRARQVARRAEITAWALFGLAGAVVTALAISGTARRNNRFLAGGVVALDALVVGVAGALLAPALARLLGPVLARVYPQLARAAMFVGRKIANRAAKARTKKGAHARGKNGARDQNRDSKAARSSGVVSVAPSARRAGKPVSTAANSDTPTDVAEVIADFAVESPLQRPATMAGLLVLAPLCALAFAALVFAIVADTRAPLSPGVRASRIALAGAVVVLMPAAIALAAGLLRRPSWKLAAPVAALLFVPAAIWFVRTNWIKHLQFVPWADLRIFAFVIVGAAALAPFLYWAGPRGIRRILLLVLVPPLALVLGLWAGGAEKARKATAAAGGVVGPLLGIVRPALDFDHDGYPGLLGGGDCDDHNPKVNPGAQDWPEDGVDDDCDGSDLRAADLQPPPLHPVPEALPRDLNVLLVVIDTLRADRLGAYGYDRPTSPEIDKLARDGVVFDNAWAHAPSTRYSMPAIVTGRWPSAIKWDTSIWWPGIARGQPTIAEAMRGAGYFTGAFYAYGYFNRGDARGFERGIDQYDDRLAAKHINKGGPAESTGSSAREMADDGIDFLRAYRDQKFFLSLHFYDPHMDYQRHPGAPDFGSEQSDLYDGEVWFTDKHVGRVIAALKDLGLYDKTAIFVTGDHGEGFGEHGIVAHGYDLYAPQTKVPLVARVPGLGTRHVGAPVGHVDLAPTLVNLARGKPEPSFLGRSMLDLIAGTPGAVPPPTAVFQEVTFEPRTPGSSSTERRGLATATHHLLWNSVPENTVSCFDRSTDPGELHDLWGLPAGEAVCPGLKRALDRRMSLLKLSELPPDFAQQLQAGITAPGAEAPRPTVARAASFGDLVRFVGYDVSIPGAPFPSLGPPAVAGSGDAAGEQRGPSDTAVVRIARGGDVVVTTHFEVRGDVTGWRIFFHLDGPGGTSRNLDHTPVGGAYPVPRWRPGQTIRDRYTVHFGATEAPGLHTLAIGFWQPPSSARKRLHVTPTPLQDGQDRLRVLSFQVE
jgi:arylsulfatase A-like enzyme